MSARYSSSPALHLRIGNSRLRAILYGALCLFTAYALWSTHARGHEALAAEHRVDPVGGEEGVVIAFLHDHAVVEHVDAIGIADGRESVRDDDCGVSSAAGADRVEDRALGSGERVIHSEERPAFLAKNRYGLPDTLSLDWSAFAQAMPATLQPLLVSQ